MNNSYPTPSVAASDCFAERRDPIVAVQNTLGKIKIFTDITDMEIQKG